MGKATLLIVEKDDTHALLLKNILSRHGYAIAMKPLARKDIAELIGKVLNSKE